MTNRLKDAVDAHNRTRQLHTGTVGAAGELAVCADLLRRGYEVFRSVTPCSPYDLLVAKNNRVFRVEVRTRTRDQHGNWKADKGWREKADVYAAVFERGLVVEYIGLP